jgi:hypothetical protein
MTVNEETTGSSPHRDAAGDENEEHYDISAAYDEVKDHRCRVAQIRLGGLKRTKQEIVERELIRVKDARTLEQVLEALEEAHDDLMALEIFEAVDLAVDRGAKVMRFWDQVSAPCAMAMCACCLPASALTSRCACLQPNTCTVKATFKEKPMYHFQSGTFVQGTEGVRVQLNGAHCTHSPKCCAATKLLSFWKRHQHFPCPPPASTYPPTHKHSLEPPLHRLC